MDDLDPSRPTALTLLGQPLAVWRDGDGEWRVLEDRCSHRLAPLTGEQLDLCLPLPLQVRCRMANLSLGA